jgi:hypothetical protein
MFGRITAVALTRPLVSGRLTPFLRGNLCSGDPQAGEALKGSDRSSAGYARVTEAVEVLSRGCEQPHQRGSMFFQLSVRRVHHDSETGQARVSLSTAEVWVRPDGARVIVATPTLA